jgi:ribosome recycling factor
MSNINKKMEKTLTDLQHKIQGLRTNRANPDMIKNIQVNYYGSFVPLHQVASISTPESTLFSLNIFDQTAVKEIEKAIMQSSLGLTPQTEGNVIRIILPELTQERRTKLIKILKQMGEESKIALRNIRRDAMDTIKTKEKNKEISEDEVKSEQDSIQKATDLFTKKIDETTNAKEKDLLTI